MTPQLRTKDNRLTRYAFSCGYIEEKNIDDDNRISMSLEPNGFHIKGFKNGKHFWAVLENPADGIFSIKEARKAFDLFLSEYELIVPYSDFYSPRYSGVNEQLKANKVYKAELATNQPKYAENGLIFVGSILLGEDDYYKINW